MKIMRKFLALLLCLVAAFCVSACDTKSGGESGGGEPSGPSGGEQTDPHERYKIKAGNATQWNEAAATICDGFTLTIKPITVEEESASMEAWSNLCYNYNYYTETSISGTKSDTAVLTLRYDGNRILTDWNDEVEARFKDEKLSSVFDNAFERVWKADEGMYEYYCYLKNANGDFQPNKFEYGTTTYSRNPLDDKDALRLGPSYFNCRTKDSDYSVIDANAWWYGHIESPLFNMVTDVAGSVTPSDEVSAKFDETSDSYKVDKVVAIDVDSVYADMNTSANSVGFNELDLFVQNFEIKFDNGKCVSVSYDAYDLAKGINKIAFSVEAVRNTDFVELPGGGHGRGKAYSERAEKIANADTVINGAARPANFTKIISVKPDKISKTQTIDEEHTFKVTDTAIRVNSKVYEKKGSSPATDIETEIYQSKEADKVYYYSQDDGSWKKQADQSSGGVDAVWKGIVDERYNFLSATDATKDKPDEEKPKAPYDLRYDAENGVYWSPTTGHCICINDGKITWSRVRKYVDSDHWNVFIKWIIKDIGITEVTLPQVA